MGVDEIKHLTTTLSVYIGVRVKSSTQPRVVRMLSVGSDNDCVSVWSV